PDLSPFFITDEMVQSVKQTIPPLATELEEKYGTKYLLSEYDARVICDDKQTADYFESIIKHTDNYKAAANWLLGPVKSYLNENHISIEQLSVSAKTIAKIIHLTDE